MKLSVAINSAQEALRANILRSFLTMLGIVIGVASVMTMMSISEGARARIDAQISSLGANLVTLRAGSSNQGGRNGGSGSGTPFTEMDVAELQEQPWAKAVSGYLTASVPLNAGSTNWQSSGYGVNEDYIIVQNRTIVSGRNFTSREVSSGATVGIIGTTARDALFPEEDPVGQRIRVKGIPVTIIGLLNEVGESGGGQDKDDVFLLPLSMMRNRISGGNRTVAKHVSRLELLVNDGYEMPAVEEQLAGIMRERRDVEPGGQDDFSIRNVSETLKARNSAQTTLGVLLAFTAAVSLIVGGVGVMNIMLVSVTERTKEIGLRMAIGAKPSDIMAQFLIEAIMLCVIGGVLGVGIGYGGARLAASTGEWPVSVSPFITMLSLGASAAVGVFFGFFPARRASKLNPIEALRYE